MTLPHERRNSVLWMREAVVKLIPYAARRGEYVRVRKADIEAVVRLLKHYPTRLDVEQWPCS